MFRYLSLAVLIIPSLYMTIPGLVMAKEDGSVLPGVIDGVGNSFKITNSEYLNIGLESSEPVKVRIESIPERINITIESVSGAKTGKISISDLHPLTTYYKYQDDFHNQEIFVSDEKGSYAFDQDLTSLHNIFIQTQKSTIFIKDDAIGGDCNLIGIWDMSSKTCTLGVDINETIQIDSDNLVLDGNGHTLMGTWRIVGVYLYKKTGVTVRNLKIQGASTGIYAFNSSGNVFVGNIIDSNSAYGILLYSDSSNNMVKHNTISRSQYFGVHDINSGGNIIYNNNFIDNKFAQANNYPSNTSAFYMPFPVGGNFWNDFDAPNEGCTDLNKDRFCDSPYTFWGGQDHYPLASPSGWEEPPKQECCSSVLFLPAFMASELYVQGDFFENQLWPPNSLLKTDVEKLMLNEDGVPVTSGVYTKGIVSEAFGVNVYKSFIEKMDEMVSSSVIQEWKPFPYDWRKDLNEVVSGLTVVKEGDEFTNTRLIDEALALAQRSPTGKITIIGHSNGGLVGKYLIKELQKIGKSNVVDKFIMVAVPQIGTPKAVASLLHGDQQSMLWGLLLDNSYARGLGYNMKSSYNLIPTNEFVVDYLKPLITFDESIKSVFDYSSAGFSKDIVIYEDLSRFLSFGNRGKILGEKTNIPLSLRGDLIEKANMMVGSLSTWEIPEEIRTIEISGWGADTIRGIEYKSKIEKICTSENNIYYCRPENVWDRKLMMANDGDGTVVTESSTANGSAKEYYLDLFRLNKGLGINIKHHNVLEPVQFLTLISQIISGSENDGQLPEYIALFKPTKQNQSILLSVHSPVNLSITDSSDRYTGVAKENNAEGFMFVKEEIPNSYFINIGEDKYVGIDSNENYNVNIEGYDVGTFTFEQELIDKGEAINSVKFIDIPVTPLTKIYADLDNGALDPTIDVDVDGDRMIDITVDSENEFNPVTYLRVTKEIIESFSLERSQEQDLVARINSMIDAIGRNNVESLRAKSEALVKKLNQKSDKIEIPAEQATKLSQDQMNIILNNLESFIYSLTKI